MKTRDRAVLAVLGLAGLMAALWFVLLAPKREEAADLSTQVTQAEERRDAATSRAATADQARAGYRRDYATVARLGKATPPSADVASMVYQLESAARDARVDFRSVTAAGEGATPDSSAGSGERADADAAGKTAGAKAPGITPAPFTLVFEGSFFKLHKLLRAVDRFSRLKGEKVAIRGRLLTLDSVKMSPGRAGFPQVKVEIVAKAYVAELPDPLPATGANTTTSQVTK